MVAQLCSNYAKGHLDQGLLQLAEHDSLAGPAQTHCTEILGKQLEQLESAKAPGAFLVLTRSQSGRLWTKASGSFHSLMLAATTSRLRTRTRISAA